MGELATTLSVEAQGDIPGTTSLVLLPTSTGEVLTGQGGGLIELNDLGVDRSEKKLQLVGLTAAGWGVDSGLLQQLGQTVRIQVSSIGPLLVLRATQIQDGLGLPLELE